MMNFARLLRPSILFLTLSAPAIHSQSLAWEHVWTNPDPDSIQVREWSALPDGEVAWRGTVYYPLYDEVIHVGTSAGTDFTVLTPPPHGVLELFASSVLAVDSVYPDSIWYWTADAGWRPAQTPPAPEILGDNPRISQYDSSTLCLIMGREVGLPGVMPPEGTRWESWISRDAGGTWDVIARGSGFYNQMKGCGWRDRVWFDRIKIFASERDALLGDTLFGYAVGLATDTIILPEVPGFYPVWVGTSGYVIWENEEGELRLAVDFSAELLPLSQSPYLIETRGEWQLALSQRETYEYYYLLRRGTDGPWVELPAIEGVDGIEDFVTVFLGANQVWAGTDSSLWAITYDQVVSTGPRAVRSWSRSIPVVHRDGSWLVQRLEGDPSPRRWILNGTDGSVLAQGLWQDPSSSELILPRFGVSAFLTVQGLPARRLVYIP